VTGRPEIVPAAEWLAARRAFLAEEKEFTRARDALNARRRELPMTPVTKEYTFHGPDGPASLPDLFDGRRTLIAHHLMFDPDWAEGCTRCRAQVNDLPHLPHLYEHDVNLVLVSRAPLSQVDSYRRRMGWTVPYFSSAGSDFNYDFHVTLDESVTPMMINFRTRAEHEAAVGPWDVWGHELPGISVFLRDGDAVYLAYATYARGLDILRSSLNYLDHTPFGRDGA
jgi:predicted dithiol-disulfide oxidoreductase (DUF899 family)